MQNILVVDDDDSLRDTIGLMLEQEGFHVTLVEDGLKGYNEALHLEFPQQRHSGADESRM